MDQNGSVRSSSDDAVSFNSLRNQRKAIKNSLHEGALKIKRIFSLSATWFQSFLLCSRPSL